MELVIKLSTTYQTYYILNDSGLNIEKTHEFYTHYNLFLIFKELYPDYFEENTGPGRPRTYTASIMLPFITWGHINGIFSCRKLEYWWGLNDDTCNFILDCKKPPKSSINEFSNKYDYLIDEFDIFLVDFGLKTGLMGGEIVYHDGTFLKGYCNYFKRLYANQLYYLRDFILEHKNETNSDGLWFKLKEYFDKNKFEEEIEPILYDLKKIIRASGIHLLKKAVENKKSLKKVLLKIKHMEENVNGNNPISTVDPEAHNMKDKNGIYGFNYNYQVSIDDKCGMVVAHYTTTHGNDKKELLTTVNLLNERLHTNEYVIVVDHGYWHIKSLHEIYGSPTTIIIPDRVSASRTKEKIEDNEDITPEEKEKSRFKKHKFYYDWELDCYFCPNGCKLIRRNNITQNGIEYKVYRTDECTTCPNHDLCTSENKRTIKDRYDPILDSIKRTYYSEEGQEIYSGRGSHAEGAFVILFESRNFRGIKTRGTKRANDELTLTTITHNIKKIHKHMDVNVLKKILNEIKKEKTKSRNVDMSIFDKWIGNYVIKDGRIIDLKI